jgi:hypothetical protein
MRGCPGAALQLGADHVLQRLQAALDATLVGGLLAAGPAHGRSDLAAGVLCGAGRQVLGVIDQQHADHLAVEVTEFGDFRERFGHDLGHGGVQERAHEGDVAGRIVADVPADYHAGEDAQCDGDGRHAAGDASDGVDREDRERRVVELDDLEKARGLLRPAAAPVALAHRR